MKVVVASVCDEGQHDALTFTLHTTMITTLTTTINLTTITITTVTLTTTTLTTITITTLTTTPHPHHHLPSPQALVGDLSESDNRRWSMSLLYAAVGLGFAVGSGCAMLWAEIQTRMLVGGTLIISTLTIAINFTLVVTITITIIVTLTITPTVTRP